MKRRSQVRQTPHVGEQHLAATLETVGDSIDYPDDLRLLARAHGVAYIEALVLAGFLTRDDVREWQAAAHT